MNDRSVSADAIRCDTFRIADLSACGGIHLGNRFQYDCLKKCLHRFRDLTHNHELGVDSGPPYRQVPSMMVCAVAGEAMSSKQVANIAAYLKSEVIWVPFQFPDTPITFTPVT